MDAPSPARKRSSTELEDSTEEGHVAKRTSPAIQNEFVASRDIEKSRVDTSAIWRDLRGLDKPHLGRDGLRRSIVLALQHVGFDSASEEALDGFTSATETCRHFVCHRRKALDG
jgi:hypothetical protein